MKWIKRIAFGLLTLLAIGQIYEFSASRIDKIQRPHLPGKLVDIGGYRLHLQDTGKGDFTVILESGMTFNSLDWSLVQPEISKFARVCSYDRAGLGWSDESPFPRTSEQIVSELHTLLQRAGIPKPYIFVGHSMGGIHARLYAYHYPDEVEGIILVDSSHEEMYDRLPPDPLMGNEKKSHLFPIFLCNFGVQRLILKIPQVKHLLKATYETYPEQIANTYFALQSTPKHFKMALKENRDSYDSLKEIQKYPRSLGEKPLIVITAAYLTFIGEKFGYSKDWINQSYKEWEVLQTELLELSGNHKHFIAKKSDHFIPRHQPEIIVEAVGEIINMIQERN